MGQLTIETDGWRCAHPNRHWTKRHIPCQDCARVPRSEVGYYRDWAPLMPTIARLLRYSFEDANGFYLLTAREQEIVASPERFHDLKVWVSYILRREEEENQK